MNWQIILNPFTKFSERQLLLIGVFSAIIGNLIASAFGVTYDGVLDVHLKPQITFLESVKENVISIIIVTLLLFVLGKLINAKTRFIDILNSCLFFRIPIYLSALLTALPIIKTVETEVLKNIDSMDKIKFEPIDLIGLIIISVILIVLLIYAITLLFQGFKTATNAKKGLHYLGFGIAIVLAEVISKIVLSLI